MFRIKYNFDQILSLGQSAEYTKLLEEDNKELDQKNAEAHQKITQLQSGIDSLEGALMQMDDEKRQLKFENESLKSQLSHIADRKIEVSENYIPDNIREIIFIASKALTPKESMAIITKLFPNRVEVLESASKSADESEMFKEIMMMKHLKIGNKPSVSETIRIHFEWDASDKKIIIGHCGPHLDHK